MLIFRGVPAKANVSVALTIGNFDGMHLGHQAMLKCLTENAKLLGLPATVLTFEPHPREFFDSANAPARLTSLREKLELFAAHGVERVHICRFDKNFARISAQEFVERILYQGLQACWIVVGDDFHFGARRGGNLAMLQELGATHRFQVVSMPSVLLDNRRVSSTAVRDALACGDLELARRLLGRSYSISGQVVHGDKTGRKLGFPTANIHMKHNKPPLSGIFAVELCGLDGGALPGVASVGVRPTVRQNGQPVLEVHLFDFDREIYGRHVRVDFMHKLRDEEKYPDLETLATQIALDVENAKNYFVNRQGAKDAK